MMISKIPTISLKNLPISNNYRTWFILGVAIISIGLLSNIWLTLIIAITVYIASIVYTITINFKKS